MFPLAARRLPSRRAAHACACACARTRLPPSPPIAQAAPRRSLTAAARPRPARCPLTVIRMPSLSPSMVSATVTHWNVDLGAPITCGELIVEVETDTLDEFKLGNVVGMEIEAWDDGYLARVLMPVGASVAPGEPIALMVEEKGQLADWLQDESELLPALRRRGEGRSGLEDVPDAAFERRFAWQAYLKDARDSNGCGCS